MTLIVLRRGPSWIIPSAEGQAPIDATANGTEKSNLKQQAKTRFEEIADTYGSRAVWLTESGYLVSDFPIEESLDYPYEKWRDQALREANAHLAPRDPAPVLPPPAE